MVDFGEMLKNLKEHNALPPQERAYLEEKSQFESNVPWIVKDEAMRNANAVELRVLTLGTRASDLYVQNFKDVTGEYRSSNQIKGAYLDDGRPMEGSDDYKAGKRFVHYESEGDRLSESLGIGDRLDPIVRGMDTGAIVSVAGRDVDRKFKNLNDEWKTVTEFHAMRIGLGELSMEELSRPLPGSLTDFALRHHAAKDQVEKDAIAKDFLSQPQPAARVARLAGKYERSAAAKGVDTGAKGPSVSSDGVDVSQMRSMSNER